MQAPRFTPDQLCAMLGVTREQIRAGHLNNAADCRKKAGAYLNKGNTQKAILWLDRANEAECLADWIVAA